MSYSLEEFTKNRFKFRYIYKNKLYNVDSIDFLLNGILISSLDKLDTLSTTFVAENILQCTGHKDINETLIFDKDIVKTQKHNLCDEDEMFLITYAPVYSQFLGKSLNRGHCLDLTDLYNPVIIGNEIENSELLNKEMQV